MDLNDQFKHVKPISNPNIQWATMVLWSIHSSMVNQKKQQFFIVFWYVSRTPTLTVNQWATSRGAQNLGSDVGALLLFSRATRLLLYEKKNKKNHGKMVTSPAIRRLTLGRWEFTRKTVDIDHDKW